ncbi:DNA -binding domain-containing protein [Hoeflea alexandrii]|uniref:DNA -binding domain-containing protein n=1 Tax=Hoeflea alexandrii TaxID=288436 RepID=UPI0022AF43BE|nr:DUF2285 domain-containing protein [Hoeflea alexandrii]MCZ4288441.1 DUF2285 domain-containing protein [Hoeflea alexandrii]
MAEGADWRHGEAYEYVDQLDPAGLAWEFLRRNRKYQSDYERIPKHKRETVSEKLTRLWGLRFPRLPFRSAIDADVFFAPHFDPGILLLASPSRVLASDNPVLTLSNTASRKAPEGHYLHIEASNQRFPALCLGDHLPAGPVAAITLLDQFLEDRVEAIRRFAAALHNRQSAPDLRVNLYRRNNFRQMLRIIDARRSGATYQDIAEVVLNTEHVSATTWKTMPERDTVMRRFREGTRLVEGAYRGLLFRHRPLT